MSNYWLDRLINMQEKDSSDLWSAVAAESNREYFDIVLYNYNYVTDELLILRQERGYRLYGELNPSGD